MSDEELINHFGIRPVLKRLPGNVKAFSAPLGDGYAVVINDALGPVERLEALSHELTHIKRNDHFIEEYEEYDKGETNDEGETG